MGDWGWKFLSASERRAILRGIGDGGCYGGPFHAELQPTDHCNISCYFCCTRPFRCENEMPLQMLRETLGQLRDLGTHSITLNGGGEPLSHSSINEFLEAIPSHGLLLSNLTTNGTLLTKQISELLVSGRCRQVIVSLNAGNPADYSRMMRVPEENFHVVTNAIRNLVRIRRRRRASRPRVVVQFLVSRQNFRTIPQMYEAAKTLEVDGVLFNDVAGVASAGIRDAAEAAEEIYLLREILQREAGTGLVAVQSHTRDIGAELAVRRTENLLRSVFPVRRLLRFARRAVQLSWHERISLLWGATVGARARQGIEQFADSCIAPWHTITISSGGDVPVCCALQDRHVDQILDRSIRQVWYGHAFRRIREQVRRSMISGERWQYEALRDTDILASCAANSDGDIRCRFKSFFYSQDWLFRRDLARLVKGMRGERSASKVL